MGAAWRHAAILFVGMLCSPKLALAEQAGRQFIDDVRVNSANGVTEISIDLLEPMRYVRHLPSDKGEVLQIWLKPAMPNEFTNQAAVPPRETVRLQPTEAVPLLEVSYEAVRADDSRLLLKFVHVVGYKVRLGEDFRHIVVELTDTSPAPEPQPGRQSTATSPLLEQARQAMVKEDWVAAIGLYAKSQQEADPAQQQEALEMLGLARERNGQPTRAKAEYEKFLTLYPNDEGSDRVRQRLTGLLSANRQPQPKLKSVTDAVKDDGWETFGSLSQYYFRDASITDHQGDVENQSLLLNNLDVTSKRRTERYDVRAQLDARYRQDFLRDDYNQFRVSNAFVDLQDRQWGAAARLGRQIRSSGGVLGRFDGGVVSYRFLPQWKATLVGGFPVLPYRSTDVNTDKSFYGLSLDFGPYADNWAGNVFFIQQDAQGKTDRRAVGGELRYQHPVHPVYGLLDFDIFYNELNIAQVTGNWNFDSGATVNLSADYRKTPLLSTSNALQGFGSDSIPDLLRKQMDIDLKQLAENNTGDMKNLTLGAIMPIDNHWQINGDITVSNLSGIKGTPWTSPYQGTGTQVSVSAQLIANGLFSPTDIWNLGVRYNDQKTHDVFSLFFDGRYAVTPDIRIDPRLRLDYFAGLDKGDVYRIRPALRFNYRLFGKLNVELEGGFEYSNQPLFIHEADSKSYYISAGYRWDF